MSSGVVTSKILDLTGFSYSKPAYQYSTEELIENAETQLYGHKVEFDSMVGIGLSGILVLPLLARHFNVPFFACRKGEETHHNSELPEGGGRIGKRWILIDDAKVTGSTIANVRSIIKTVTDRFNFDATYVGTYSYNCYDNTPGSFEGPEDHAQPTSMRRIYVDGVVDYVPSDMYYRVNSIMEVMSNRSSVYAVDLTMKHFEPKLELYGWSRSKIFDVARFIDQQL